MVIELDSQKGHRNLVLRMAAAKSRDPESFFRVQFDRASSVFERTMVCCAAYDMGYKKFARERNPAPSIASEFLDKLVSTARDVVGTSAGVDFMVLLHRTPLRNRGQLHERGGQILRINFTDGTSAFCKSFHSNQEAVGIDLAGLVGLPNYHYRLVDGWIVMQGVAGATLCEHVNLSTQFDARAQWKELFARILAITAFDYTFGLMDRNDGGLIFGLDAKPVPIDHEYLLTFLDLPLRGVSILHTYMYLREFEGPPPHLSPRMLTDNMQYVREFFRRAEQSEKQIIERLTSYLQGNPIVDLAFTQLPLSVELVQFALSRIHAGPRVFCSQLIGEIGQVKAAGMFLDV